MPKDIYNEGRVVGMSAYELYLRHQMSEYPELKPVTEREWLASTIGAGCSLILRIPKDTPAGIFERQLPDNSTLCAATNITASVFDGQVILDASTYWATSVVSYGPLIANTSASHPVTPGDSASTVPVGTEWTQSQRSHLKEYMKVIDGLVYQPGTWSKNTSSDSPYMDFSPDLHSRGTVRLKISKKLDQDVYVMITGWVYRPIIAGCTKLEAGALNAIHPWNGDFLGAERFPWSVKITFTVPTEVMHILNDKAYIRELVKGTESKAVTAKPIIDFDSIAVQQFYNSGDSTTYPTSVSNSKISMNVTELNVTGDGASVVAAYQRTDLKSGQITAENYPPILYGARVTQKGDQQMVPIDTGAPGTVKMFDNKDKAIAYPKVIPNTYAFYHDKNNKSVYLVEGDTVISLDTKLETENLGTVDAPKYTSIVKSGNKEIRAISLFDPNHNMLNTSGSAGQINAYEENDASATNRNLTWNDLLTALGANKVIDLIGSQLHRFRKNLPDVTSGDGGVLKITGTRESSIAGSLDVGTTVMIGKHTHDNTVVDEATFTSKGHAYLNNTATINRGKYGYNVYTDDSEFAFSKPIKSGANYIVFNNGLRLYISSQAPSTSGVPIGSIGIGW